MVLVVSKDAVFFAIRLVFAIILPEHVRTAAKVDGREQSAWKVHLKKKGQAHVIT